MATFGKYKKKMKHFCKITSPPPPKKKKITSVFRNTQITETTLRYIPVQILGYWAGAISAGAIVDFEKVFVNPIHATGLFLCLL